MTPKRPDDMCPFGIGCATLLILLAVVGCSMICPPCPDCLWYCVNVQQWVTELHDRVSPVETMVFPLYDLAVECERCCATLTAIQPQSQVAQATATPEPRLVLRGDATHISDALVGRLMRNGQPYDRNAAVCAVDNIMWHELQDAVLTVCASRCVTCTVTDSGYLLDAGVAIDLAPILFERLAPLARGRIAVKVWR